MTFFEFSTEKVFTHNMTGKFKAPTPEWIHLTRNLTDFELILVTEGTLYIGDDQNKYSVRQGEFLIMSPTSYQHGLESSNCSFYWLHFTPNAEYFTHDPDTDKGESFVLSNRRIPNSIILPRQGKPAASDRLIVLMKQLQDSDKRYHDPVLNNFLTSTILSEIYNQTFTSRAYGASNDKNQLFNDIVDYVSWHISENIKVTEIAEYFGYNEKYLSTFFHKFSGIPLKQHILQCKIDHAKAELTDTNRSISQIAYNIGFSDPHNFTNAFKKITGFSPTEYRTSYAKRSLFYK